MHVSARADYAVRAVVELAAAGEQPVKSDLIATAQGIPAQFLEQILGALKRGGIVRSRRGPEGGFWLARPGDEITIADVVRAVDGPLAYVQGEHPDRLSFEGSAAPLREVWVAVRASLRQVLETVTVADVARGSLPEPVPSLVRDPDAWVVRR